MLTMNCTPAAIELNDPSGDMRRTGVDFSKLPVTHEWQWRSTQVEVRQLCTGRMEVRTHRCSPRALRSNELDFGPRTVSHALHNPAAPKSHAVMIAEILGNGHA